MFGYLAGLEANKLSAYVMRFTAGAAATYDGAVVMTFPSSQNDVNMQTTGLWGLDTGAPAAGKDYFPYILRNATTGIFGIVMSNSKSYGGVVCPAGFAAVRKLPFGIVLNAAGIPSFHASHFPKPAITFTDFQGAAFSMLSDGSTNGTLADLSDWVPDNARLVWLACETGWKNINGPRAGSAYIKAPGTSLWRPIGNQNKISGVRALTNALPIRCDSLRRVAVQTTGDAWVTGTVVRYEMTEPMC